MIDHLRETERLGDGRVVESLVVFLAGAECPFTCVFCDLWRYTLDGATPQGALPRQLRQVLDEVGPLPASATVKLYNASNFFEPRAVPPADRPALAALVAPFERAVVECHPRLVGASCFDFAASLDGRLEVAIGLETVHPVAQPRLGKGATLDDFDRAAERLARHGVGMRAFLLIGVPFVAPDEQVAWVARSVGHAFACGASHVSLVPVRGGNGELERLRSTGDWTPPRLDQIEQAVEASLPHAANAGGVVTVDLWDLDDFARCEACARERVDRLAAINADGLLRPPVDCTACRPRPFSAD